MGHWVQDAVLCFSVLVRVHAVFDPPVNGAAALSVTWWFVSTDATV